MPSSKKNNNTKKNKKKPSTLAASTEPKLSSSSLSKEEEEKRFLRLYSKALADALRENEAKLLNEQRRINSSSLESSKQGKEEEEEEEEEMITNAYVALCHDEPIVDSDIACMLLGKRIVEYNFGGGNEEEEEKKVSLMKHRGGGGGSGSGSSNGSVTKPAAKPIKDTKLKKQSFGLSNRLVDGIFQSTSRTASSSSKPPPPPPPPPTSSPSSSTIKKEDELKDISDIAITKATPGGYSELAYRIYLQGPYYCCCCEQEDVTLEQISLFLGSFRCEENTLEDEVQWRKGGGREGDVDQMVDALLNGMMSATTNLEDKKENDKEEDTMKKRKEDGEEEDGDSSDDEMIVKQSPPPASSFPDNNNNNNDDDSLKELIAEESDPDDYDYGADDDNNYYTSTPPITSNYQDENDEYTSFFDPIKLSKPPPQSSSPPLTWKEARIQIKYLLSNLSYSKVSFVNQKRWKSKELNVSKCLKDLVLLLLHHAEKQQQQQQQEDKEEEEEKRGEQKNKETLLYSPGKAIKEEEDVSQEWNKPLFVLRDRALDGLYEYDAMEDYLDLVGTLLSSSSSGGNNGGGESGSGKMKPSVAVGLTSLSSLCTSPEMTTIMTTTTTTTTMSKRCKTIKTIVKNVIVQSFDDLADIVECIQPTTNTTSTSISHTDDEAEEDERTTPSWVHAAVLFLPIFDFLTLTKSRFDYAPLFDCISSSDTTKNGIGNKEAQSLLNSGLFRELILLFTKTRCIKQSSSSSSLTTAKKQPQMAQKVIRTQILRTLFTLCAQSTNLLAKYASRVPEFTREVYDVECKHENLVDAALWSILGSFLLSSAPASRLKLKKPTRGGKVKTEATVDDLKRNSFDYFVEICDKVQAALLDRMPDKNNDETKQSKNNDKEAEEGEEEEDALFEYIRFTNCITNCPNVANAWCQSLSSSTSTSQATNHKNTKESLIKIISLLSKLSSFIASEEKKKMEKISLSRNTKCKDDDNKTGGSDNDCDEEKKSQQHRHPQEDEILASVRKGTKMLLLLLEDDAGRASSSSDGGAASLYSMSSKTD